METNLEIESLIKAVISLRMNATKKDYGPTVKAVQKLNISITYALMDPSHSRKAVISCLLGKKVTSTKLLTAGEVGCLIEAIEQHITKGTLQKLEMAIGNYVGNNGKPENLLIWNDDQTDIISDFIYNWWPMELPIGIE